METNIHDETSKSYDVWEVYEYCGGKFIGAYVGHIDDVIAEVRDTQHPRSTTLYIKPGKTITRKKYLNAPVPVFISGYDTNTELVNELFGPNSKLIATPDGSYYNTVMVDNKEQ